MKIIFMGTPDFAVPSLKALISEGYEICLVVTQPDRPKGRGNKVAMSSVKEAAISFGIEVFQPENVKNGDFAGKLRSYNADLIVTAAYGKILTEDALTSSKFGCINVHASLLPKYRGAAPLWRAIIDGEKKTGITTMFTDLGMDTGDILETDEIDIDEDMTVGELSDKMAKLGAVTLIRTLEKLRDGTLKRTKQDDSKASYAPKIEKNTGHIEWGRFTREIYNLIRGTNPWPAAYTYYKGERMKIFSASLVSENKTLKNKPGTIVDVSDDGILTVTGDGLLLIKEIQFDSAKRMLVKDYIRGHRIDKNTILGGI